MHKKLTITVEEDVYRGLHRVVGRRRISQFIEELVRPHVTGTELKEGYRQMALDGDREREAIEWSEATSASLSDETR
jgi:predicted CopG family antitoxin